MAGPYWCYVCQQQRSMCGGQEGTCPRTEALAAEYRDDLKNGRVKTMFKTRRLAAERDVGMSQREMARETIDTAKAEGRDIESVAAYGDIRNPKDH